MVVLACPGWPARQDPGSSTARMHDSRMCVPGQDRRVSFPASARPHPRNLVQRSAVPKIDGRWMRAQPQKSPSPFSFELEPRRHSQRRAGVVPCPAPFCLVRLSSPAGAEACQ